MSRIPSALIAGLMATHMLATVAASPAAVAAPLTDLDGLAPSAAVTAAAGALPRREAPTSPIVDEVEAAAPAASGDDAAAWPATAMRGADWVRAGLDRDIIEGVASTVRNGIAMTPRLAPASTEPDYSAPSRGQVGALSGPGQMNAMLVTVALAVATVVLGGLIFLAVYADANRRRRRNRRIARDREAVERSWARI